MRGLSPVAASGGHSSSRCAGLSLSRPLLLRTTGSRRAGSAIVAHEPSCSAACGIFPDQGSNPCPLHWQADSQPLRHQGSPLILLFFANQVLYAPRMVLFAEHINYGMLSACTWETLWLSDGLTAELPEFRFESSSVSSQSSRFFLHRPPPISIQCQTVSAQDPQGCSAGTTTNFPAGLNLILRLC